MKRKKTIIGRQEWCSLPELHIKQMRAKIDTGAKTSAMHAEDITLFNRGGKRHVRFLVRPIAGDTGRAVYCEALLVDTRSIASSNNSRELRYIIRTKLVIGDFAGEIELSLTNRHLMRFNILLGREALNQFALVDPSKTYVLEKQGKH